MSPPWHALLRTGLHKVCDAVGTSCVRGVNVERVRPRSPLLFLSGATPGPFYHSHPHVPSEFDHLDFSMEAQLRANLTTIQKIGRAVADYADALPFDVGKGWIRSPQILHWVSRNGHGYQANCSVVEGQGPAVCAELGMDRSDTLGIVEVGDNVSDRRFLLESFAMFALQSGRGGAQGESLRIDIKDEFDPKYFMPYVPAYLVHGHADLALFAMRAAPADGCAAVPDDGEAQVSMLFDELVGVLRDLGSTFEDVIVGWARVPFLNEDEEAVLMTRSKKGLHRPLAESVLGLAPSDDLGEARPGVPWRLEYVVVAQIPAKWHVAEIAGGVLCLDSELYRFNVGFANIRWDPFEEASRPVCERWVLFLASYTYILLTYLHTYIYIDRYVFIYLYICIINVPKPTFSAAQGRCHESSCSQAQGFWHAAFWPAEAAGFAQNISHRPRIPASPRRVVLTMRIPTWMLSWLGKSPYSPCVPAPCPPLFGLLRSLPHPYPSQPQTRTKEGLMKAYPEPIWGLLWVGGVWVGVVLGTMITSFCLGSKSLHI